MYSQDQEQVSENMAFTTTTTTTTTISSQKDYLSSKLSADGHTRIPTTNDDVQGAVVLSSTSELSSPQVKCTTTTSLRHSSPIKNHSDLKHKRITRNKRSGNHANEDYELKLALALSASIS